MNIASIKEIILPILQRNGVTFAGIFGSYARGEQSPESDVDILVKFSKPIGLFGIVHLENILSETLHHKVDLVTEGALSPYIRESVMRDLKVVYG